MADFAMKMRQSAITLVTVGFTGYFIINMWKCYLLSEFPCILFASWFN
jgi:hypothetical protein